MPGVAWAEQAGLRADLQMMQVVAGRARSDAEQLIQSAMVHHAAELKEAERQPKAAARAAEKAESDRVKAVEARDAAWAEQCGLREDLQVAQLQVSTAEAQLLTQDSMRTELEAARGKLLGVQTSLGMVKARAVRLQGEKENLLPKESQVESLQKRVKLLETHITDRDERIKTLLRERAECAANCSTAPATTLAPPTADPPAADPPAADPPTADRPTAAPPPRRVVAIKPLMHKPGAPLRPETAEGMRRLVSDGKVALHNVAVSSVLGQLGAARAEQRQHVRVNASALRFAAALPTG